MQDLAELDRQVAEILEYIQDYDAFDNLCWYLGESKKYGKRICKVDEFHPSTNSAQAMDLVKQFDIKIDSYGSGKLKRYTAEIKILLDKDAFQWCRVIEGDDPELEIAICKAVVASAIKI